MISETDISTEIRNNLHSGDLIKARLVVASLAGQRAELQQSIVDELRETEADIAVPVLGSILDLRLGDLAIPRLSVAAAAVPKILATPTRLLDLSEDAQIHVSTALGDSRDARALKPLRQLLTRRPQSANLRFTLYDALSKMHLRSSGYMLAAGLEDKDVSVRVAAARAIEKNLDDTLKAGIRNMLRSPSPTPANIVRALAEACALNTIEALLDDDPFAAMLGAHLEAHPDVELMTRLKPILLRADRHLLAEVVENHLAASMTVERPLIYVVDDSSTILLLYEAALVAPQCTVKTFDNPFDVLQWIDREPPDLLFTDLNMPGMDGIELASAIRSDSPADTFPIIMVTTQSYGEDIERALNAGVDGFVQKPFAKQQLIDAITDFTDYRI